MLRPSCIPPAVGWGQGAFYLDLWNLQVAHCSDIHFLALLYTLGIIHFIQFEYSIPFDLAVPVNLFMPLDFSQPRTRLARHEKQAPGACRYVLQQDLDVTKTHQ